MHANQPQTVAIWERSAFVTQTPLLLSWKSMYYHWPWTPDGTAPTSRPCDQHPFTGRNSSSVTTVLDYTPYAAHPSVKERARPLSKRKKPKHTLIQATRPTIPIEHYSPPDVVNKPIYIARHSYSQYPAKFSNSVNAHLPSTTNELKSISIPSCKPNKPADPTPEPFLSGPSERPRVAIYDVDPAPHALPLCPKKSTVPYYARPVPEAEPHEILPSRRGRDGLRRVRQAESFRRYLYLRRQLKPWSDKFRALNGRTPSLADVYEAGIPGLLDRFVEYLDALEVLRS